MATKNEISLDISELALITKDFNIARALLILSMEDEKELENMSVTEATDMIVHLALI